LYCLSFFNLWLLITSCIPSNFSYFWLPLSYLQTFLTWYLHLRWSENVGLWSCGNYGDCLCRKFTKCCLHTTVFFLGTPLLNLFSHTCEKLMKVVQANIQIFLQFVFMVLLFLYQKVLNDLSTGVWNYIHCTMGNGKFPSQ